MIPYIQETLKFLEKTDFKVCYPSILHIVLNEDGGRNMHMGFSSSLFANLQLNNNENLKFIIIFSMLDVFIDSRIPGIEGESFRQKYLKIPKNNDYDLILSELFRVAKVIRNALVHNPSGIAFEDKALKVEYFFHKTQYLAIISDKALTGFYTLIVMYVKGDLGNGEYFLALAREIYDQFIFGVVSFCDDLKGSLLKPNGRLRIKSARREIILNPHFKIVDSTILFSKYNIDSPNWTGADFFIEVNGEEFLIPQESLNTKNEISIDEVQKVWGANNKFPPVRKKM